MKKNNKKIVGIIIVFLIVVAILSISYAYFLTQIVGNDRLKSVDVETANLELVYEDGNGIIAPTEKLEPGYIFQDKEFSVTNNGDDNSYIVILENVSVVDGNGNNTSFVYDDFYYTLSCKNSDGTSCNGSTEKVFPMKNIILVSNSIPEGEKQSYVLKLVYKDTETDQSLDMNKTFSAKVNIADLKSFNPYDNNTSSLAYNIINNSVLRTGGTELFAAPLTIPGEEINNADEKELTIAEDEYGWSYYYRGNVNSNYLDFAGMCWRIVRVEGDGAVKIVLYDRTNTCSSSTKVNFNIGADLDAYKDSTSNVFIDWDYTYGPVKKSNGSISSGSVIYGNYNNMYNGIQPAGTNSSISASSVMQEWLTSKNVDTTKLKNDKWCLGDYTYLVNSSGAKYPNTKWDRMYTITTSSYFYEIYNKLYKNKKPTLTCNRVEVEDNKDVIRDLSFVSNIGMLTADELFFAGYLHGSNNKNSDNYLESDSSWWTQNLYSYDRSISKETAYILTSTGYLTSRNLDTGNTLVRPAVTLKKDITITRGNGTKTNPYVIS